MATRKSPQPQQQPQHEQEEFLQVSAAQLDPVALTLAHREMIYGSFSNNALTSQKLKEILRAGESYHALDYTIVEALDMIASKLARIVNGQYHPDNFVDIAGYATLVLQENGSN